MVKRICPKCFTRWYSSSTGDDVWTCEVCKSEIPKSQEVLAENEKRVKEEKL